MKINKLNSRGFSHDVLLVLFVAVFAISGVGYLVASHAAASSGNPNNCQIRPGVTNPTPGKPSPLYNYFNNGVGGKSYKDHFYTLIRNDTALASLGWCYSSTQGYAYNTQVAGTVPLYQYWSGTIYKHFYTTAPTNVEPNGCCGYQYEGAIAFVSPGAASGTTQLYRFFNAYTQGHFYTIDGSASNITTLKNSYGYNLETVQAYVWTSPSPSGPPPPTPTPAPRPAPAPTPAPKPAPKPTPKPPTKTGGSSWKSSGKPVDTPAPAKPAPATSGTAPKTATPPATTPSKKTGSSTPKPPVDKATTKSPSAGGTTAPPKPPAKKPLYCKVPIVKGLIKSCVTNPDGTPTNTVPAVSAVSAASPSSFKVKGTRVYTASGKEFIPYGISVVTDLGQPGWQNSNYQTATDAQIQAAALYWHSNTIRLQVSEIEIMSNPSPGLTYNSTAMDRLVAEVDQIESLGKVPVINDNVQQTDTNQLAPVQRTVDFWKAVTSYLDSKNRPEYSNVILDVFNEPSTTGSAWQNGMQSLVNAVRKGSTSLKNNLIWIESSRDKLGLSNLDYTPITGSNLVFAYHHVDMNTPSSWDSTMGLSLNHKVALVDGEWAQYASARDECKNNAPQNINKYFDKMRSNHIGMIFWSLEPGVGTKLSGSGLLNDKIDDDFPLTAAGYSQPNHFPANPATYSCTDRVVTTIDSRGNEHKVHYLTSGQGAGADVMAYFKKYSN